MHLQFDIQVKKSYLHVSSLGEIEFDGFKDLLDATFETAAQHRLQKVLIDSRLVTGTFTIVERYNIGVYATSLRLERRETFGIRIGIVRNPLQ